MTNIAYVKSSRFLGAIENAIRSWREDEGNSLDITLDRAGYAGHVVVTIRDGSSFDTDWRGKDSTRFPARIKAAATALFRCGFRGLYEISHKNGLLKIRRAA